MSFIFKNFLSLLNIIYLNILILIKKNFFKKKIVIFYYPKEKLVINNISIIYNYFLKESNYFVFYGSTIRIKKKNFFLIKQTYLKFLFNIFLFLSNNVCDKFSVNSKKIYIHHDIYDTPLVEKKKEKALRKSLLKYDSIVVASEKSSEIFKILFMKIKKKPKIIVFKYLKIDFLKRKLEKKKSRRDYILIAPTNFYSFPKFTIQKYLFELIDKLLKKNHKIIYRPHPSNFKDKSIKYLKSNFLLNKNFIFDDNPDYFQSYNKANFLISDISGTAYTYAITSGRPVIFFNNDKYLKKFNYDKLNYFMDREKVGWKFDNVHKIISFLNKSQKFEKKKLLSIKKFQNNFFNEKKFDLNYLLKND